MKIIANGYTDEEILALAEYYEKKTNYISRRSFILGSTFGFVIFQKFYQQYCKKAHVIVGGGWGGSWQKQ